MNRKLNKEPQQLLNEECMEYFRHKPVFDRLMKGFREKYESYGYFTGTVQLKLETEADRDDLEGFLQRNYHGRKSASVSASRFEKALKDSRFGVIEPVTLLEMYYNEPLQSKKEQRDKEHTQLNELFQTMTEKYEDTPAEKLIRELDCSRTGESKSALLSYIMKIYRDAGKNIEVFREILQMSSDVLNNLPYRNDRREYLAVFAAAITGNPHAFDDGSRYAKLLYMIIKWDEAERGICLEKTELFPALYKQKCFFEAGILRDDISNCCMISGIRAWKKDGTIHSGISGFEEERDMMKLPLSVIAELGRIECAHNTVYIVENPSVFAMICRWLGGESACMCTNGQPRLSALLILELLAESDTRVYYAGDMDPEGLLIAQTLRQYYKGDFHYWNMTPEAYQESMSEERISDKRLKILDRITDDNLIETAALIREKKHAGYQENICELFLP